MQIYVVKPQDTVTSISASYGISADSIIYNNQIPYPYELAVGQALLLSTGPNPNERLPIKSNGYAYPFISPWVLDQTLPYLTELSVFSYGFTPQGDLLPPPSDDGWMTAAARNHGTLPVLTLTPLDAGGNFNNALIHDLLYNPFAISNLLEQLAFTMGQKGYGRLDIDFEYILAEDRDAYSAFIRQAADAMHAQGYRLSVALAPQAAPGEMGILTAGQDYRSLGEAADQVLLMTYEWGYKFGPNLPVAPLDKVRQVVEYAVTQIPPRKIMLGIPNYGYDWPLPYIRGVTEATTIGNVEAVRIAVEKRTEIQFDETAMSPFFRYTQAGIIHEVWFEDVRSLLAKFELIQEFGLLGAGYWQIMDWFLANWLLLADVFWIEKGN